MYVCRKTVSRYPCASIGTYTLPTINVLFENGLVKKKILSLPAIIAVVGSYIAIFELNLIGVTSLLLYIHHRHNNVGIQVQYYILKVA